MRKLLLFLCSFVSQLPAWGQLRPEVMFHGFLDNREYFNLYAPDVTIFGCRTAVSGIYDFGSNHTFQAGVSQLLLFGQHSFFPPEILVNYRHHTSKFDFRIGSFPRHGLMDYPLAMLSDTLLYYRPQIEGVMAVYNLNRWQQSIWIDWTSLQTEINRETFLAGTFGKVTGDIFFIKNYFILYHFAKTATPAKGEAIRDNLGAFLSLGLQVTPLGWFDELVFESGYLQGADRDRALYDWKFPGGILTRMTLRRKWIGAGLEQYYGDHQLFMYGDGLYKARQYTRFNLMVSPSVSQSVRTDVRFSFHLVEGTLDFSQLLSVRFVIDKWKTQ